jgi:hypothetical protein
MHSQRRSFFLAFASGHALVIGFLMIAQSSGQPAFDGSVAILTALFGALFFASVADAPHKVHLLTALGLSLAMAVTAHVPERVVELASRVNCSYGDSGACNWVVDHSDSATALRFAAIGCSRGETRSCVFLEEN